LQSRQGGGLAGPGVVSRQFVTPFPVGIRGKTERFCRQANKFFNGRSLARRLR